MPHPLTAFTITSILETVKGIVSQDKQNRREKGEDFNVFAVIQMESSETKTHSNMLAALLNPKQDHYYGSIFLKLFLEKIGYDYGEENLDKVSVQTEYHLGEINKDFTEGGFIDILITFSSGKTITIENKIYAGDQEKQMYRYSLFNRGNSTLYYLNLFGDDPSKKSLFSLIEDDYTKITYTEDVVKWLDACIKVTKEGSIVESCIKQYLYLVQKLTYTMNNDLENQLSEIILNNLDAAKYIQSHYQRAVFKVREKFRHAVYLSIGERLDKEVYNVWLGNDCNHKYSQIWIDFRDKGKFFMRFGVESFSAKGAHDNRIFVGLFDREKPATISLDGYRRLNRFWPIIKDIKTPEDNFLNLSSTAILEKLGKDNTYFEAMVAATAEQSVLFIKALSKTKASE